MYKQRYKTLSYNLYSRNWFTILWWPGQLKNRVKYCKIGSLICKFFLSVCIPFLWLSSILRSCVMQNLFFLMQNHSLAIYTMLVFFHELYLLRPRLFIFSANMLKNLVTAWWIVLLDMALGPYFILNLLYFTTVRNLSFRHAHLPSDIYIYRYILIDIPY